MTMRSNGVLSENNLANKSELVNNRLYAPGGMHISNRPRPDVRSKHQEKEVEAASSCSASNDVTSDTKKSESGTRLNAD